MSAVGAMLHRDIPPAALSARARRLEALGYAEAWVVEDCFWTAAFASAGLALGATERLHVGIGVLPAVLRNPALAAMELATLAGAFPGRVTGGFGHGVTSWMRQVGAHPRSPLAALEETLAAVRDLLAGRRVTVTGRHVALDDVALVFPPERPPALLAGVTGPRGLRVAAAAADGAVLPECSTSAFVRQARATMAAVQSEARLVVYALLSLGDDPARARDAIRPYVADWLERNAGRPQLAATSFAAKAEGAAEVPDAWIEELAIVGDATACADATRRLFAAGADTVVLVPMPAEAEAQLERYAATVLPALRRRPSAAGGGAGRARPAR